MKKFKKLLSQLFWPHWKFSTLEVSTSGKGCLILVDSLSGALKSEVLPELPVNKKLVWLARVVTNLESGREIMMQFHVEDRASKGSVFHHTTLSESEKAEVIKKLLGIIE